MEENKEKPQKPCFRWLHISDLHVPGDETFSSYKDFFTYLLIGNRESCDKYEQKGMRGILADHGGVDCIVITGDLFNRGDVSLGAEENIGQIVGLIYQLCAECGKWNQDESMSRLSCPPEKLYLFLIHSFQKHHRFWALRPFLARPCLKNSQELYHFNKMAIAPM